MAIEGFQFIHESTYGRKGKAAMTTKTGQKRKAKWSGREIVAEAIRELGNCDHVESPIPPQYVLGSDLLAFWESIEQKASEAKDTIGRKLRSDKQLLTAGVCSAPILTADFDPNNAFYQQWLKLNLDFLKNKYGADLGPVLLHTDEKYIHLHYYVAPEVQNTEYGFTLEAHHAGLRAKNAVMKDGNANIANVAYKKAMKAFQDSYYEQVAKPCGLTRSGPKRRRLTRDDWKEEKRLAAHLPQLLLEMEEATLVAESALIDFEQAERLVEQARNQKEWNELQSNLTKEELTEYKLRHHEKITQLEVKKKVLVSDFNEKYERNQLMDEDHNIMIMEMQIMESEVRQREKKTKELQQSQQRQESKLRQKQVAYTETQSKLEHAKAIISRAETWQERGTILGAFFSRFNGVSQTYENQIEELHRRLEEQATKYTEDLNAMIKKNVEKVTVKLKGLLDLAYKTNTKLEGELRQARKDMNKMEENNQELQNQNELFEEEKLELVLQLKQYVKGEKKRVTLKPK